MKHSPLRPLPLALAAASCLALTSLPAADVAEQGRLLFHQYRAGVVTVQLVIKSNFSMMGMANETQEMRQEVTGTVMDPSGLTVLSLASTDPGGLVESVMGSMEGALGDEMQLSVDSQVSDVKILTETGLELPAEVVLRDRDLDLVFIRPKTKPAEPLVAIPLERDASVDVLDQVITLSRLPQVANRTAAVSVERISGVVERPRRFYVASDAATMTALGSPAFTPDGRVVGIFVLRTVKGTGSDLGMLSGMPSNLAMILLPAKNIRAVAEQIPTGKP